MNNVERTWQIPSAQSIAVHLVHEILRWRHECGGVRLSECGCRTDAAVANTALARHSVSLRFGAQRKDKALMKAVVLKIILVSIGVGVSSQASRHSLRFVSCVSSSLSVSLTLKLKRFISGSHNRFLTILFPPNYFAVKLLSTTI